MYVPHCALLYILYGTKHITVQGTEGSVHTTDDAIYWKPAATVNELYKQLSSKKYREIGRKQVE